MSFFSQFYLFILPTPAFDEMLKMEVTNLSPPRINLSNVSHYRSAEQTIFQVQFVSTFADGQFQTSISADC